MYIIYIHTYIYIYIQYVYWYVYIVYIYSIFIYSIYRETVNTRRFKKGHTSEFLKYIFYFDI